MAGKYKPTKGFNYEDDHDYDDAIDYAAQEMVYWYGKYYPKENIDKMFEYQGEGSGSGSGLISKPLLGVIVGVAGIYGAYELGSRYLSNRAYEKRQKEIKEEKERKKKAKNL